MKTAYSFRFVLVALATWVIGVSVMPTRVQAQDEPRTQYDLFDLSTPENAVTTFIDTFHRRDYAGAFLIFAPQTQQMWYAYISRFQYDKLINPGAVDQLMDAMKFGFNHTETEHSPNLTNYLFDQVMLVSEEYDAFIIDLRGTVEILRSEEITIPAYGRAEDTTDDETPLPAVDVITSVEGIDDEVIFRMVPSPSGRWQLMQVRVPGGDERDMPWSASVEVQNISLVTDDFEGVIFAEENAAQTGLEFEFGNDARIEYWTPTEAEVLQLEANLVPFLQGAFSTRNDGEEVWGNLDRYQRQYFGIELEGEPRQIYANYFCSDHIENWQTTYVFVLDGGNCYFQLRYDPEAGVFSNLRVNGDA